jgi:hypothetical protein
MAGHACYHCKRWVEEGEAHDCRTTTGPALAQNLTDDLRDAWARLHDIAAEFGDPRIYASIVTVLAIVQVLLGYWTILVRSQYGVNTVRDVRFPFSNPTLTEPPRGARSPGA